MAVIDVRVETHGSDNDARGLGEHDGCLASELVFFVRLSFADAKNVRLVQTVDFVSVVAFLISDFSNNSRDSR